MVQQSTWRTQDQPQLELLEPRLLLSAAAFTDGDSVQSSSLAMPEPAFAVADVGVDVVFIGNHPDATARYTWTDADGDTIAPVLTGAGFAALYFDGDALQRIELQNTTLSSNLGMKVTRFLGQAGPDDDGDGRVWGGSIASVGGAAVGTLNLGTVDLLGDIDGVAVDIGGAVKTVKLGAVDDGLSLSFGGGARDKFSFLAGSLGDVAMTSTSPLTQLTVTRWDSGSITAPAIGAISAKGDFGPDVTAQTGNIGNVTIIGGDLNGSLIASAGRIGNITVTAVATWSAGANSGALIGGNVQVGQISAGAETGKAIGNIKLTGGSFDAQSVTAPWDMGNFTIKSIRYKSSAEALAVLNRDGSEKTDRYGDTIYRTVSYYTTQGGHANASIDIDGKLGAISVTGGDLSGDISAAWGTGPITVQGILANKAGTVAGVSYTKNPDGLIRANLTASLWAVPGLNLMAIPSIKVVGGDLTSEVVADGKIGKVSVTAYAVVTDGIPELFGGNFLSTDFQATNVGNITLLGGSFAGSVEAYTIGNLSVTGGDITGSLRAYYTMGNITGKTVTVGASMAKWQEDGVWQFTQADGMAFGQNMNVTIYVGIPNDMTVKPRLGVIKGIGMQTFTVSGELTLDPAKVSVVSQKVTYVSSLEVDPDTARVTQKNTTTIGVGQDEIDLSGLTQLV